MSLLDDVSIVVTPNGYKAGELYAVVPTDALGSEQVTNGDYTEAGVGNVISQSGGVLVNDSNRLKITSDGSGLYSRGVWETNGSQGERFIIKADIISTSGTVRFIDISNNAGTSLVSGTTFEIEITLGSSGKQVGFGGLNDSSFEIILDNVSVKEITGADMDVTRATAATRVDEDGLVNYAEVIGSDLVTNGDFATDSDWVLNTGWSIADNKAIVTNAPNLYQRLTQSSLSFTLNLIYKISVTCSEYSSGYVYLRKPRGEESDTSLRIDSIGTFVFTVKALTELSEFALAIGAIGTDLKIDNISVKEVTRDNVPRIDYTGGGCPHILAEPQRTNLLTYSEDFSQWAAEESSVSLNTLETLSPDGKNNATILTENTSFGKHGVVVNTTSGGSSYSFSFFAKYKTRQFISIVTSDDVYWQSQVVVNLIDGSITKEFSRSYTITNKVEDFGNGWYKISASINGTYNTRFYSRIYLSNVAVPSDPPNNFYTGESLSAYIWAAQLEEGSYPTSYIPTSGSTVTRNQDIFTRDGIGSLINDSEGVLFAEIAALANDGTSRRISLSDGSVSNRVSLELDETANKIKAFITLNGASEVLEYTASDLSIFNKIAIKWKANDFAIWFNGSAVVTETAESRVPTGMNELSFTAGSTSHNFDGKVRQLQVYNTALTDEQLLQLTGASGTDFYESYAEMASALTYTIQ